MSGTAGSVSGCQAQWSSRSSRGSTIATSSDPGHGAPASIQALRASTSSAESGSSSGGIRSSSAVERTRRTSSLVAPLPATTAGPKSPPLSKPARESSRRPDSAASAPWQVAQRASTSSRAAVWGSWELAGAASAAAAGQPAERISRAMPEATAQPRTQPESDKGREPFAGVHCFMASLGRIPIRLPRGHFSIVA